MDEISKKLNKITDEIIDNIYEFQPAEEQNVADYIYSVYESYVDAGFTEKQAFELTKIVLSNLMKVGEFID